MEQIGEATVSLTPPTEVVYGRMLVPAFAMYSYYAPKLAYFFVGVTQVETFAHVQHLYGGLRTDRVHLAKRTKDEKRTPLGINEGAEK